MSILQVIKYIDFNLSTGLHLELYGLAKILRRPIIQRIILYSRYLTAYLSSCILQKILFYPQYRICLPHHRHTFKVILALEFVSCHIGLFLMPYLCLPEIYFDPTWLCSALLGVFSDVSLTDIFVIIRVSTFYVSVFMFTCLKKIIPSRIRVYPE